MPRSHTEWAQSDFNEQLGIGDFWNLTDPERFIYFFLCDHKPSQCCTVFADWHRWQAVKGNRRRPCEEYVNYPQRTSMTAASRPPPNKTAASGCLYRHWPIPWQGACTGTGQYPDNGQYSDNHFILGGACPAYDGASMVAVEIRRFLYVENLHSNGLIQENPVHVLSGG